MHDTAFEDCSLPNLGFFKKKFETQLLSPIISEINEIKNNNFYAATKFNHRLAGNIEKEYLLSDNSKDYLSKIIMPLCIEYDQIYNYVSNHWSILEKDCPIGISTLWVNFQKKHEFNPVHNHSGIYSFVIWIDIPYDIADEKNSMSSKHSNCNYPGHFEFVYTDTFGKIKTFQLPADKSYNNTMVLFPSQLSHVVYPFFTSDEYRITVSGNVTFLI
jgi:hypothetical protein